MIDNKQKQLSYKQKTIALMGWTAEEYDKKYDVYRLRVRNFEKETGAQKGSINAAANFHYTLKAEKAGKPLKPQKRAIRATPAKSTAKKKAAQKRYKRPKAEKVSAATLTKSQQRAKAYYMERLKGLLRVNPRLLNFINDDSIAWEIRQQKILEYLNRLDGTRKQQINRAREEVESAVGGGRTPDLDDIFQDYGDGDYDLDFDFYGG